ncbi:MAG: asparagine synthetase B family protein, partial [Cytophagales bacterium]
MCGIFGFENRISKPDLHQYQSVLKHRGPDGIGFFQDDFISFIHWRLSIIDLSNQAAQPFFYRNWVLIFNGEIYNFKRIAKILTSYGYRFSTQSDSEVLIKAFDCWREKAVDYFIGMFAFAIYDQQRNNVWLFRDRLGVKPLYYSLLGGLSFASELKAFKAHGIDRTIDQLSINQYFRFGYNLDE